MRTDLGRNRKVLVFCQGRRVAVTGRVMGATLDYGWDNGFTGAGKGPGSSIHGRARRQARPGGDSRRREQVGTARPGPSRTPPGVPRRGHPQAALSFRQPHASVDGNPHPGHSGRPPGEPVRRRVPGRLVALGGRGPNHLAGDRKGGDGVQALVEHPGALAGEPGRECSGLGTEGPEGFGCLFRGSGTGRAAGTSRGPRAPRVWKKVGVPGCGRFSTWGGGETAGLRKVRARVGP